MPIPEKKSWKDVLFREMGEYAINVCYLTLVFAAFTQFRRLVLAAHDIAYTDYWVALIEAVILGKVILIGDALRIGRGLETRPLILPTLYKTVVFTLFVALFTFVEHGVRGWIKGEGFTGAILAFLGKGPDELIANSMIIFVALVPFFAVRELGRVLGEEKIRRLFFRRRTDPALE